MGSIVNPIVLLNSGETLTLRSVLLYDEERLREIELLRAQAAAKAGPVSSGIGFIGSPGWVLGASAVLSLFEAAATKQSQKEALFYLQDAERKSQALIESAAFCDFASITNAHLPHPELWRAETKSVSVIDLSNYGWGARSDILKRYVRPSQMWSTTRSVSPVPLDMPTTGTISSTLKRMWAH